MDTVIPISQARTQLPSLVDEVADFSHQVFITVKGKVRAALVSAEDYMLMQETLEILSDPEAMKAIRRGEKEITEGKGIPWDDVKKQLGI